MYWHILAAKLAFVVVFEVSNFSFYLPILRLHSHIAQNVVALVMIIVKWGIPDIPSNLRDRIRREAYITNEIIIKQETLRAQSARTKDEQPKMTRDTIAELTECPATPDQWDRLINKSLSGSEFDLMVHGNSLPNVYVASEKAGGDVKAPTSV